MKINVVLFLTIFMVLNSCAQNAKVQSFEGIITYKITVTTYSDNNYYNDYQKQKYGDKLKLHIWKDGSFIREFVESGSKGFDFFIFNSVSNECYTKWRNIDTIFVSNCIKNSLKLKEEKDLPSEEIYGQTCKSYFISGIEPISGQTVSLTYFYPTDKEYINPALYKNYKDFFYNKVIDKLKAPFYKLIMDMGNYTVTFEVEKIEQINVNFEPAYLLKGIPLKRN